MQKKRKGIRTEKENGDPSFVLPYKEIRIYLNKPPSKTGRCSKLVGEYNIEWLNFFFHCSLYPQYNLLLSNSFFSYIDDCQERHTIFPDKDFLGLCPNTGFVKVSS